MKTPSAALITESDSLFRTPHAKVTIEDWHPNWTKYSEALSSSKNEQYSMGHCACSVPLGDGTHVILWFRSGSIASPTGGTLYKNVVTDFTDPSTWESGWTTTGVTGVMRPAWGANGGSKVGAGMDCCYDPSTGYVHLFYFKTTGALWMTTFDETGALIASTTIATLSAEYENMHVGAVRGDECFITRFVEIETSKATWHKPVYGTTISRYYLDGTWQLDSSFFSQQCTHFYAGLAKDNADYDAGNTAFQTQWGKRVAGGLAANMIDTNTVAITMGLTHYHRYGQDTHSQSLYTWLFYRDSGIWQRVTEAGTTDYQFEDNLEYDMCAKGSILYLDEAEIGAGAVQVVVWSRLVEPVDFVQVQGAGIPRAREVVYALFRPDGKQLSNYQYLGHQDFWTGAYLVLARGQHPGPTTLCAFGWRAWAVADIATWLYPADLSLSFPDETDLYIGGNSEWYNGGGLIEDALVKGAYQAVGAANQAASYVNLHNPGTNDLTVPGNAPDWSALTGWTFDKTNSEYLRVTNVGPTDEITIIIRYQHYTAETFAHVISVLDGTNWWFIEAGGSDQTIYRARDETFTNDPTVHPWGTTKTAALVSRVDGKNYAYVGSTNIGLIGTIGVGYTPSYDFFLGAANNSGTPSNYSNILVEGFAIYDGLLTEAQILAVIEAMDNGFILTGTDVLLRQEYEEVEIFSEFEIRQSNRRRTTLSLATEHGGGLFDGTVQKYESGNLVRAYLGNSPTELAQVAQGFIDTVNPTVEPTRHGAQVTCRQDKLLQDLRAEAVLDLLPQNTQFIAPNYPISDFDRHNGKWGWARIKWANIFFAGQYPELVDRGVYRLFSSPEAATGGALVDPSDPASGGGGKVWDTRPDYIGSWWTDVSWLTFPTMVDGAVEAKVRFGDDRNYAAFNFLATTGYQVYATQSRTNGIITVIDWRTGGYSGPIWNTVAQEACMAGLICHAVDIGKKYSFVWEANSNFAVSSHTDDTWKAERFDSVDWNSHAVGANKLYLIFSSFNSDNEDWEADGEWVHIAVASADATGLTPGKPAELKMLVAAGTIYCFYRNYVSSPTAQEAWRFAFSYKAGHFGAGKFGLIGRGSSGIHWDYLYPGRHHIVRNDNVVDFWDIKVTDGVIDKTMEDNLRYIAWNCRQETEFRHKVDEVISDPSTFYPLNDAVYSGLLQANNPVIDFDLTPSDLSGAGEWGVAIRADNSSIPTNGTCIMLLLYLDANNTLSASSVVKGKFIFRRYASGSIVREDYQPIYLDRAFIGNRIQVRFSALEDIFTCWIAGNYVGHILDDTELAGEYVTVYSENPTGTDWSIVFQELYEVPQYGIIDINQPMAQAMDKLIGKRRIKSFFRSYSDQLLISYFLISEVGPVFQNVLTQSSYQITDRFASIVNVQGACNSATYANPDLLLEGRRYLSETAPEITEVEHLYLEAKAILKEIWERVRTLNLTGLYDWRVEPEDTIGVIVTWQNINNYFLVDDIIVHFAQGNLQGADPVLQMGLGVRQFVDYNTMSLSAEGAVPVQDEGPPPVSLVGDALTYARFYGVWMDTYYTYGGLPDDPDTLADDLAQLRFFGA